MNTEITSIRALQTGERIVALTARIFELEQERDAALALANKADALRAEIADLRQQIEAIGAGGVEPLRQRQDHVEDDLNMLAADAARYRWLRDPNRPDNSDKKGNFIPGAISGLFVGVDETLAEGINGDELDAAIDAAMARGAGGAK